MKLVEFEKAQGQRLLVKPTEVAAITIYTDTMTILQLPGGNHIVKGSMDYVVGRLGGKVHKEQA